MNENASETETMSKLKNKEKKKTNEKTATNKSYNWALLDARREERESVRARVHIFCCLVSSPIQKKKNRLNLHHSNYAIENETEKKEKTKSERENKK